MTTPKNGTLLKMIVGSLITAVVSLMLVGYASIASRLDNIEKKMDVVVETKTKIEMLEVKAVENRTLILNHLSAQMRQIETANP
jgi:hypothetical protein